MNNPIHDFLTLLQTTGLSAVDEKIRDGLNAAVKAFDAVPSGVQEAVVDLMSRGEYDKAQSVLAIPAEADKCKVYIRRVLTGNVYVYDEPPVPASTVPEPIDDPSIERHALSHSNQYTKPHHFEIEGKRYDLLKQTWVYFFYTLCDVLYARDPDLFDKFANSVPSGKVSYFHVYNEPNKLAHKVFGSDDKYVSFQGDAESVRRYAQLLLSVYGLEDKTVIYWARRNDPVVTPQATAEKETVGTDKTTPN